MHAYFSITTVILYLVIGFLGYLCIQRMMKPAPQRINMGDNVPLKFNSYWLFIFIYTFIAVFREVSPDIGGADALVYKLNFETILKEGFVEKYLGRELESGFTHFTYAIRSITSSYKLYFLIVYAFISYSYILFIKEKCPRGLIYIPFILLMCPFLRSFNTLRTSMAVGFILIGISMLDKRKWLSLLFLIAAFFFHRISILYIFIWPFYYLTKNRFANQTKWQFIIFAFAGMILAYFAAVALQTFLGDSLLLDDRDMHFLMRKADEDHFGRYPLVIGHILLFTAVIWFYNKIRWDEKSIFLRDLFIYDLWVAPAGVILGMWRFVEYLYIVRLSLWCVVLFGISGKMKRADLNFAKFIYASLFIAWLIFRIFKEYDDAKISPYIFDFSLW